MQTLELEINKEATAYREGINDNKNQKLNSKILLKKSIGFFKLQYQFLNIFDYFIIFFAILGSFVTGISLPLFALLFGETISELNNITSPSHFVDYFRAMCLKFIYVGIGTLISGVLMITLWTYNGRTITNRLRINYFNVLMLQEQGFFDNTNTHELCFKIQNQILEIENGLGVKVGNSLFAFSMFISSFVVGYYTSWKLSLVISSVIPIFIIGGCVINNLIKGSDVKKHYEEAGGIAEEVIYNIKTVTSFANYDFELKRYNDRIENNYTSAIYNGKVSTISIGVFMFIILNTFSLAVWYGSVLITNQEKNTHANTPMTVADVLVVVFTIVFGSLALGQAGPNLKAVSNACVMAYDYFALTERIPKIDLSESIMKPDKDTLKGEVVFKNVSFSYQSILSDLSDLHVSDQSCKTNQTKSEKSVLKEINLKIEENKKTAIVGQSGSGKSTVASLLERLYDPTGEILFDGINIKKLDIEYLRSIIAYAPQEPVLFNTSIKENIIFGRANVTQEEIENALKKSLADGFVKEKGLNYLVGIKGSKLSAGQRQRIALARALLKKPKILILDEITSSLDYNSEVLVHQAIDNISKETTTLVIANRLTTIINSDYIYVLNEGVIIEEGTHDSLLLLNGFYSALIQSQLTVKQVKFSDNKKLSSNEMILNNINNPTEDNLTLFTKESKQGQDKEIIIKINIKSEVCKLLANYKLSVILGILFLSCMGSIWPAYGMMLAGVFTALATSNKIELKRNGETMALYFVLMAGVTAVLYSLQSIFLIYIGENITKTLRKKLFEKYLTFHMGYFDIKSNSPSNLISRLNSDTSKITGIALSMIGLSIQMIVALLVGLILSAVYDWRLSLIAISFMPLTVLFSICTSKSLGKFKKAREEIENESSALLIDSINNTKVVFVYNMQTKISHLYKDIVSRFDSLILKASLVSGVSFGIILLLMFIDFGVLFYAGASFLGKFTIQLDNMLKSIFSILFALFGITMGQQYIGDITKLNEAFNNIFKTLKEKSKINPFTVKKANENIIGRIEFKNVSFSYSADVPILKNVSFVIQPETKAAFIGFSGSGKSTIIQLIERFYDPDEGEILIDDIDLRNYNPASLRKKISLVMEEPSLFKRDLYENIRYGDLNADDHLILLAAQKALIDHYVNTDNKGKNLIMSGGERQRVALARALIREPRIVLLDEVTSALDKNTEEVLKQSFDKIFENKTVVMVAHK